MGSKITLAKAQDEVNAAYMAEDYDLYEALISRFAPMFGMPEWHFEDTCTDVRILGHDSC